MSTVVHEEQSPESIRLNDRTWGSCSWAEAPDDVMTDLGEGEMLATNRFDETCTHGQQRQVRSGFCAAAG